MKNRKTQILVYVGGDLIGDAFLKLPFLLALKQAWPHSHITWLAGQRDTVFSRLLADVRDGLIDEVIDAKANLGHPIGVSGKELLSLSPPLKGRRFDVIIDTQRGGLPAWRLKMQARLGTPDGGKTTLTAPFAGFMLSSHTRPRGYKFPPSLVRQMLDLVEMASGQNMPTPAASLLPIPAALSEAAQSLLPSRGGGPWAGICPGAGGKHKCWPLDNFIALGRKQIEAGRRLAVILGPAESDWLPQISAALPEAFFPLQTEVAKSAGMSPAFTVALGQQFAAAIANDAGVGHMMAASGCPTLLLFGPTSPRKFAPLGTHIHILTAQEHGTPSGTGAMDSISPETVANTLENILQPPKS